MKIILEERIPNPTVPYAYKNVIVEGDESENLVEMMETKKKEWREKMVSKA